MTFAFLSSVDLAAYRRGMGGMGAWHTAGDALA